MLRKLILISTLLFPVSGFADGRTMIVLDASGSMWGQIDGKTKVEIAREVLGTVLNELPAETELGLVAYGHRKRGDCSDIEVAVEVAPGTAQSIIDFANSTRFQGKTPLSEAVRVAAESMRSTEEKATVILVTDGIETCNADPCALGAELEKTGVDFTAHVVGFGLTEDEGKAVACLAEETGGQYLPAADADQLTDALTQTVAIEPKPEPTPPPAPKPMAIEHNLMATASLSEDGPDIDESMRWDIYAVENGRASDSSTEGGYGGNFKVMVPAGDYVLRVKYGELFSERPVTLTDTETEEVHFVLEGGIVNVVGLRVEGGELEGSIRIDMVNGNASTGGYGETTGVMPKGDITVTAKHAWAEITETISLAPGQVVDLEMVVETGVMFPTALYAEGGPQVEGSAVRFDIMSADVGIDGNRKGYSGTYGSNALDAPAGEFVLSAKLGEASILSEPFTVEAGKRTEVEVILNAGVVAFDAAGSRRIDVFLAQKDINGERKNITGSYDEEFQTTLPAGSYIAQVDYETDKENVEQEFEVKAGERLELKIE